LILNLKNMYITVLHLNLIYNYIYMFAAVIC
jgi:hypothetical protein